MRWRNLSYSGGAPTDSTTEISCRRCDTDGRGLFKPVDHDSDVGECFVRNYNSMQLHTAPKGTLPGVYPLINGIVHQSQPPKKHIATRFRTGPPLLGECFVRFVWLWRRAERPERVTKAQYRGGEHHALRCISTKPIHDPSYREPRTSIYNTRTALLAAE